LARKSHGVSTVKPRPEKPFAAINPSTLSPGFHEGKVVVDTFRGGL